MLMMSLSIYYVDDGVVLSVFRLCFIQFSGSMIFGSIAPLDRCDQPLIAVKIA